MLQEGPRQYPLLADELDQDLFKALYHLSSYQPQAHSFSQGSQVFLPSFMRRCFSQSQRPIDKPIISSELEESGKERTKKAKVNGQLP